MKKLLPDDAVLIPEQAECVFKGQIFDVYQWPQEVFDGSSHTFEMLKRADTVSVIAVADDKILVIDDEQPHMGSRKSFPGGRVDKEDTSILAAAQRELAEETGYKFKNWRLIKVWQPYRKMEWFVYVVLAWDVAEQGQPVLDAGEKISIQALDFDTVRSMVTQKEGYLGESEDIFARSKNIQDLLQIPEFSGQLVDR